MAEILDRQTLKALSTDTRQTIIKLLSKRPYTASELAKILEKHVTTISEHLDVLEKSGLIAKKEGTNKWVYYELTGKGEKLFKPNYYSWVVVFSVSAVFMLTGFLRIFTSVHFVSSSAAQKVAEGMAAVTEGTQAIEGAAAAQTIDFIGAGLIALSLIGFGYIGYKAIKSRAILARDD